jgi:hypothetical protein
MSAILVYTQVPHFFCCFTQHCAQPWLGSKLHRYRFAKWELAMNTPHKAKSVETTLSNTRFVQIAKSDQELVQLTV